MAFKDGGVTIIEYIIGTSVYVLMNNVTTGVTRTVSTEIVSQRSTDARVKRGTRMSVNSLIPTSSQVLSWHSKRT